MTTNATPQPTSVPVPPRLLDQLCQAARERGHPEPAVAAIAGWSRRFILFHGQRHPRELVLAEVGRFLESVRAPTRIPSLSAAVGAGQGLLAAPAGLGKAWREADSRRGGP